MGHVIYGDAPFGQQFLHVAVDSHSMQIPPHRHRDHFWWEPETSKARLRGGRSGMMAHQLSLPAHGDPPMQQCLSLTSRALRALAWVDGPAWGCRIG